MRNLIIPLLGLSLLVSQPLLAQVTVHLDRYTLSPPDTVQLTLEIDQRSPQRPDFSPLTRDFHFLGSKQMTVSSHANGENQYTTRWTVLLRPRRSGELQIPALQVNQEFSQPLLLSVEGDPHAATVNSQDSFVESHVDTDELYAGSQLLYSQRLYHQAELPPLANFSDPLLNNAELIPLGETNRYSAQVKGIDYQVVEKNYAIFPARPGQFDIPPATFSAGPGSDELLSDAHSIVVLPPAHQQTRGFWLPAATISIEEQWQYPTPMIPGADIIREITLKAVGLPASALPALMPLRNELATIKVDDVSLSQEITNRGVLSSRTERIIITPNERGEITLPAISIPWWNISTDRAAKASLPPAILQIEPAPLPVASQPLPASPDMHASTAAPLAPTERSSETGAPQQPTTLIWLLTAITLLCALGWWYTFAALRKLKQQLSASQPPAKGIETRHDSEARPPEDSLDTTALDAAALLRIELAEQDAFQAMLSACEQDLALEARLLMIDWARHFWPQSDINNSLQLSDITQNATLDLLIIDMESHIDGTESGAWSGDLLGEALRKIRDSQMHKRLQLA